MKRLAIVAVVVAVVGLAPIAKGASTGWHAWRAPTGGAFREATLIDGELVYTNTLGQGLGANSDKVRRDQYYAGTRPASEDVYNLATYDLFGVHRLARNGDYQLPTDTAAYPDGTAEIAELRLAVDGDELFVRWRFNAMPRPDAQIATLAFMTDGSDVTAIDWPHGANVRSPWQVTVTAWGTGGVLDRRDGTTAPVKVRTGDHTMEARIPLSSLPPGPWALMGGAGLHDPLTAGQYWFVPPGEPTLKTPGNPGVSDAAVWSLLFARDQPWTFDERRQAEMLWQGDASQARLTVDPAQLRAHASKPAGIRTGRMSREFESRLDLGDGIRRGAIDFTDGSGLPETDAKTTDVGRWWRYLGKLQPYTLYVPTSYPTSKQPAPLIVYLHGLNGTGEEPFGPVLGLEQEAEDRGYLLAGALGRGDNLYRGEGEVDVLEVIADIEARYRVDPNRIYLMGHSMGSQGTYAVALRNPDLFAAVAPAETLGSADLWRNARNVPWLHIGAVFDADADSTEAKAFYADRSAQGWESTLVNYQSKTHEYTVVYDSLPRIFSWFEKHRRDPNPARVSYVLPPAEDKSLGLVHDGAYWVSGMAGDPGASIDAETYGRSHRQIVGGRATTSEVNDGGPSGGDTTAELLQTTPVFGPVIPAANRAVITTRGLRAVTLDLDRMGLVFDGLALSVNTDRPIAVTLTSAGQTITRTYR